MSRNIKLNFKNIQNKFLRTISKIDNKDIDLLPFHHKSNSNNTTSDCLSFFYNNDNHSKNKLNNYNTKKNSNIYHNYSMNKENNSLNQTKKLSRSKSKTKNINTNKSSIKRPSSASKQKTAVQKNNTSNTKYPMHNSNMMIATKILKKENKSTSKPKAVDNKKNRKNSLIKNTHNSKSTVKVKNATKFNMNLKNITNLNNNISSIKKNTMVNKTTLNTPIDSDRKDEQIMNLKKEIKDKEIELYEMKNIYSNKQNYIKELENKLSSMKINKNVDEEYEKYSKIVMNKNVKMLTIENENLHKQLKEYKEKDLKMMKILYNLQKKGIKIDDLLENELNENDDKNNLLKCDDENVLKTDTTINTFTPLNLNDEQKNISCKSSINLNQNLPVLPLGKINDYYNEEYIVKNQNDNIQIQITNNYDCNIIKQSDLENYNNKVNEINNMNCNGFNK